MSPQPEPHEPHLLAALFAGQAPSLHNSQPWHWYVRPDGLDLRLDRVRVLRTGDPQARLAVLSCGAALHHARIHLAAAGWQAAVVRVPDADDPDLLARLLLGEQIPRDLDAARLVRAADRRHTDRRTSPSVPLDLHHAHAVRKAVRRQGADLTVLRPRQVFVLAEAAEHAYGTDAADPLRQRETAAWIGGDRALGSGIPATALPADPYRIASPTHLMRRPGSTLIAESHHHHTAVFALLSTPGDGRLDWLTAGEALSAGWLAATALDLAVLPLSIVTEVTASRDRIRTLLPTSADPQLALRLATAADTARPPTPRLAADAVVSRQPYEAVRRG
jgi:nitroreductase